jgi:hypothetical protein
MEVLMTDPVQGTLHGRLHIRPPAEVRVPCFEPTLFPRLRSSVTTARAQICGSKTKNSLPRR